MKILLTGATGYIGKRLLPVLIGEGHEVICAVRDKSRLKLPPSLKHRVEIIECDLLDRASLNEIPDNIEAAYYLVHSMSNSKDYVELEKKSAHNFRMALKSTNVSQVIYLSGITNDSKLSTHLQSRNNVEEELRQGNYHLTTLKAGIIIGSGSASFEIIRDLVEKLPAMVTPVWLNTRCQPIGISDVIAYLKGVLNNSKCFGESFDIGGSDVLTYKQMLLEYASVRKLNRWIWVLPVMTPRLSSYWLYFVTSTSYKLAVALVQSMKVEVVCKDNRIREIVNTENLSYRESLERAFAKIQSNDIASSWKDAFISGNLDFHVSDFIDVPTYGCFQDQRRAEMKNVNSTVGRIWQIGGKNGWYFVNFLWQIRGIMDKMMGGVGLRRGRSHPDNINSGDAIDFWRVLYANREEGRLLLFAEMKLPGEAWLEFRVEDDLLIQTATFRPRGIMGRLYWYAVLPFHGLVFKGLLHRLTR